ncbi:MAG: HAMP domain-containing sensor histidine kinase [Halioglobus sp.]
MSFWQPRSVLQLVVAGFFAVLAPLCAAIFFSIQTLEALTDNHRVVTRLVVDAARLGQDIERDVLELERRARQYIALADPNLKDLFELERASLSQDLQNLQALQTLQGLQAQLPLSESPDVKGLLTSLERLEFLSESEPASMDATPDKGPSLEQSFDLISERSLAIQIWLRASIDQLREKNTQDSDDVIAYLILQLSLLACATLALLLFFTYWINKPVKDLTQEIQLLGAEGLSRKIEISGPMELRRLGSKLEWLRQKLHETEQQKQQFLRHVSHELKTPLASLREGTDLLAEHVLGRLSQQQQEIVEIVQKNAIELQRLIENLVDYNQMPKQVLTYEEVSIPDLGNELLSHYRLSLDSKGLQLTSHGPTQHWVVDRYKLRTALDNLLSNAVNYTPDGGRIEFAWHVKDANLIIDVANSGEPVPPEDVERVFEPFFQSAAKRTGPIKGSGIGLSVARECMEAQGGSLNLVAHADLPVCFRLVCPAR